MKFTLPKNVLIQIPFLFTLSGFVQLSILNGLHWQYVIAMTVWSLCFIGTYYGLRQTIPHINPFLLPIVSLLTGLGFLMVARLAPNFLIQQVIWLIFSIGILLIITLAPKNLNWLQKYKYIYFSGGLLLLSATYVVGVNPSGFGAKLWLRIGGLFFQPSELLKILFVMFMAAYFSDSSLKMSRPLWSIIPVVLMWGIAMLLLFWQPDLGTALLFFFTFLAILYVATGELVYLLAGVILLIMAGGIGAFTFDYVAQRLQGWWNPWTDPTGKYFQIIQSLLAFANGGWFGQGLGQGLPTAVPVVHTDFVFAAIGEEYGLLGTLGILFCYWLIVCQAFNITRRSHDKFHKYLAIGIGTIFAFQVLIITGGVLKLLPMTGITLPFISYGGSSLVTSYSMIWQ
ncbi:MAG: hypothetical protein B6242_10340 [Anaerolineaceae bacterium 4572_78]|nr:MAG: hypothetical protein B6242_10340 [Anaerolineaceae bacterium 4572_78]